jgi:hypothetical protein
LTALTRSLGRALFLDIRPWGFPVFDVQWFAETFGNSLVRVVLKPAQKEEIDP